MSQTFWLREETKKNEFRRALTPDSCEQLILKGHKVVVEDWKDSIIPSDDYLQVGCEIVKPGSWVGSPNETIIVGLKALPENIDQFRHRHIFFAHVYKEQDGWQGIMSKFKKGGGTIIDLEFMTDDSGRRVCAFGYWAGYVGAALGALFSKSTNLDSSIAELAKLKRFPNKTELISFVGEQTQKEIGDGIVIGCRGRSGAGATDCLKELGWSVVGWDKLDTQPGGPFKEILNFNLFVNCVLAMKKMPPFINRELIEKNQHNLNMISDVSCDPDSDCNMIPLYKEATVLANPVFTIKDKPHWIGLVAIDNLPSILPRESSLDFSSQLSPFLMDFDEKIGPLANAMQFFQKTIEKI